LIKFYSRGYDANKMPRKVRLSGTPTEKRLVEGVLKSANLRPDEMPTGFRRAGGPVLARLDEGERARLREALAAIVDHKWTHEQVTGWSSSAQHLLLIPHIDFDFGQWSVEYEYRYRGDPDDWPRCAYALLLLLDESRPYGRDLCRCQLEGCGNFFLVVRPPKGRPQRLYCPDTDHAEKAHDATAVDRMRLSRENAKRQRAAKAARRHK
jgi:hypothetical protein